MGTGGISGKTYNGSVEFLQLPSGVFTESNVVDADTRNVIATAKVFNETYTNVTGNVTFTKVIFTRPNVFGAFSSLITIGGSLIFKCEAGTTQGGAAKFPYLETIGGEFTIEASDVQYPGFFIDNSFPQLTRINGSFFINKLQDNSRFYIADNSFPELLTIGGDVTVPADALVPSPTVIVIGNNVFAKLKEIGGTLKTPTPVVGGGYRVEFKSGGNYFSSLEKCASIVFECKSGSVFDGTSFSSLGNITDDKGVSGNVEINQVTANSVTYLNGIFKNTEPDKTVNGAVFIRQG